jgi:mannitol/fructose-specific phosphotransferase system IIA component (Ntr-type)
MALSQKNSGINRDTLSMIERVSARELASPNLEHEIEEIISGHDMNDKDRFDTLLNHCPVIDYNKGSKLEALFKTASRTLTQLDPSLVAKDIQQKLTNREKSSPTALSTFFALPHIVVDGKGKFEMFLLRSKEGIYFNEKSPAVHAIFFLAGSLDQRHLHLVIISALAQIVRDSEFESNWMSAEKSEDLRTLVKQIHSRKKK